MAQQLYVYCKECQGPFPATSKVDLAALERGDRAMDVLMCPYCMAVRGYRTGDVLVAA